jgi:hypothetical protein
LLRAALQEAERTVADDDDDDDDDDDVFQMQSPRLTHSPLKQPSNQATKQPKHNITQLAFSPLNASKVTLYCVQ